jgi:hypothetical protein
MGYPYGIGGKRMGEMLHYSLYCPHCDCWTLQHVWESGHERDGSEDWKECSVCHWRYSGLTGKWEPPRLSPADEEKRQKLWQEYLADPADDVWKEDQRG